MASPYERYSADQSELRRVRWRAEHFNILLAGLLQLRPLGVNPWRPFDVSYNQLISDPRIMQILVEGSHEHSMAGGPDIIDAWRNGREFAARAVRHISSPVRLFDVGSSNGLFLKMAESLHGNIVPYGVDRSAGDIQTARALFPYLKPGHFTAADLLVSSFRSPQELSHDFPPKFDTIYWALWSRQGTFTEDGSRMRRLLGDLATWAEPDGQLLIGLYDRPRDAQHLAELRGLGLTPKFAGRNFRGDESVWELQPAEVMACLGAAARKI